MFSILALLILVGFLTYTNMQASKRRAQEAEEKRKNDAEYEAQKEHVDRNFIASVSRSDGSSVQADVSNISRILRSWTPQPRGEATGEDEYDDVAQDVIQQLRKDVDGEKVAKVLRKAYIRKYATSPEPENVEGISTYIANWWRAYILT